ncbi:penicillin-binding protein 2 [Marinospirillum insulare]|uniref:Peptidoglycan D,D-transpeptidase MrdA n=1 Tax=Marinospirillum insulare TaxID=217169 RepID=A0ABQ5ZXI6_9GAMM|nr:penicillin-binding protein 2 [Marinospirillum insulare]GLR62660.1 penicillin-binding protein [Marinospirillum insulare]
MTEFRRQIKDPEKESRIFLFRGRLLLFFVVLLMLVLLGRMAYLQVFQYDLYTLRSERNRTSVEAIPPTRGLIYDRQGRLLADNLPSHSLTLTRELTDDVKLVVARICMLLELDAACQEALTERSFQRRRPFEPALLVDQLTEEQIARIAVNRHLLPGVDISAQLLRNYPGGEALSHALGYVGRISEEDMRTLDRRAYSGTHYLGKTGVERFYENQLHGQVGYRKVETNARGRVIKIVESELPIPGQDLELYLDAELQQKVYALLEGRRAAVVAIEPKTGGILSLVSSPGYDPNVFIGMLDSSEFNKLRRDPNLPLFDRASRGQYSPGSTIKPMLGVAALENGVVTRDYELQDTGYFQLPNDDRLYRNWKRSGHGLVDLARAIAVSNNTFFYNLAYNLGIDEMSSFMRRFGFGEDTALDVNNARTGLMPSREWKKATQKQPWFPGETLSTGIGQGYWLTTPLQLATATAVLANQGEWVQPRFLANKETKTESLAKKIVNKKNIQLKDTENWKYVFDAMADVMHGYEGTARFSGRGAQYRIAGKTGTSQVYSLSQEKNTTKTDLPEHLRDHAVFIGFAPVENPQIALAIVVENAGGGSTVAAPLARKILDFYLTPERLAGKESNRAP